MINNQFQNYDNQTRTNTNNNISIKLKKISKVESAKGISHIIFDQTGQMMISTYQGKVGVWNFNQGNLQFQTSFIAHNSEIKCAILLSNQNYYIITAVDKTIKIFQRNNEIYWNCIYEFKKLKNSFGCMIINGNGNNLFTSSENIISVWRLNFQQNQMLTCQQLLEQHKWAINAISLNKSENKLVSCSKDKKIIVWGLNENNQWEYKHDVRQSILECGNALYFLKDSQFIWVSGEMYGLDCIYVYEEWGEQFEEVLGKTINLPKHQNEVSISPVVYIDQQKQIILISQKNSIYLLREKSDGNLCIETQILRAIQSHQQSQSLTQDGKYLVYSYYNNKDDRNYFSVNEIIQTSY
ncbi:unnamed protein product [Paramecium primaurelia]|uniref:WD40-repeat-containing domain n=1 Tax=Paramecium primaurelia TaxID=5886 RepID=A0A8S1L8Q6_PARPR|nr:unnamed protein product [Paramecium primaurelia]